MLFRDKSEPTRCTRNGRKHATSWSPAARSFSLPIQERGQVFSPRQYRSKDDSAVPRFMVEVLSLFRFLAMLQLITILNRCYHFRGFVYHRARITTDQKSIEISVRPRKGSAAI